MPYDLPLPTVLKTQGWKVKIRDKERLEPPHATVLAKTRAWRWNLRTQSFMDDDPPPGDVPGGVLDELRRHHASLVERWNEMYPENPV